MVKRKYFKKSIKSAVTKAIGRYHRTKMNYVMDIYFDGQGNVKYDGDNNGFSIGDVLTGNTSEFQKLGKQYSMVKLRGILLETDSPGNPQGYNFTLGVVQSNDSPTYNNLITQPNVMIMPTTTTGRMYVPIGGQFTPTNDIQLFSNMKLLAVANGTPNGRFTVKITLYLTFKSIL